MTIDIITFTDAQFAALTEEQLKEVYSAQVKKDKLLTALEETKRKEKERLITNGTYLSKLWELFCLEKTNEYEAQVLQIREALLFYLRFSLKPQQGGTQETPYPLDYSLSIVARAQIVKTYYLQTYTNANERFNAFVADTVAPVYLGEMYAPTYDYFRQGVNG